MNLKNIWKAGRLQRWHANPYLCNTHDYLDGHHARVARIILALNPDPSLKLIMAALTHDDGESVVGDIPGPFKRDLPDNIGDALNDFEMDAVNDLWGIENLLFLNESDGDWLKFADKLDAYLWMLHHKPEMSKRHDWVAMYLKIVDMSKDLGIDREDLPI